MFIISYAYSIRRVYMYYNTTYKSITLTADQNVNMLGIPELRGHFEYITLSTFTQHKQRSIHTKTITVTLTENEGKQSLTYALPKSFLACRIPNLKFDANARFDLHQAGIKVNSNSRIASIFKLSICEIAQDGRLSHSTVTD